MTTITIKCAENGGKFYSNMDSTSFSSLFLNLTCEKCSFFVFHNNIIVRTHYRINSCTRLYESHLQMIFPKFQPIPVMVFSTHVPIPKHQNWHSGKITIWIFLDGNRLILTNICICIHFSCIIMHPYAFLN